MRRAAKRLDLRRLARATTWTGRLSSLFFGAVVAIAMHDCLISFGSNRGNSAEHFLEAAKRLNENSAIASVVASTAISTRPTGGPPGQSDFLNGCFRLRTSLTIENLFECLRQIEAKLGRERRVRWGERTIDLDLLLVDDRQLNTEALTIPHPRMSFRRFVLQPADQIAAEMIHAPSGCSIRQLLEHLDSKPDRITLVASQAGQIDRIAHDIQMLCQSADWDFEIVSSLESLESAVEKTKLLVYTNEVQHELRRQAMTFPGPALNLGNADEQRAVVEIQAAIDAMKVN